MGLTHTRDQKEKALLCVMSHLLQQSKCECVVCVWSKRNSQKGDGAHVDTFLILELSSKIETLRTSFQVLEQASLT